VKGELVLMAIIVLGGLAVGHGVDCGGIVLNADHHPVANAHVSIWTARVKRGTSPLCPSCYPDCKKQASTDLEGRFSLADMDTELLFDVLVVAEGYCPHRVQNVDPAEGRLEVVLSPDSEERLSPAHVMKGRVVGPDGRPVGGATVSPVGRMVKRRMVLKHLRPADPNDLQLFPATDMEIDGGTHAQPFRSIEIDPLAVTNERGEFSLYTEVPDLTVDVLVCGRGLAPCHCPSLRPGSAGHEIRLGVGCAVKGRLDKEGRFTARGLATARYDISARIRGYHISAADDRPEDRRAGPDDRPGTPFTLEKTIDQDVDELTVLLIPDEKQ
jgi:hypothetical protein